jgi:hypothetical protein
MSDKNQTDNAGDSANSDKADRRGSLAVGVHPYVFPITAVIIVRTSFSP